MKRHNDSVSVVIVLDGLRSSAVKKLSLEISFACGSGVKVGSLSGEIIPPFSFEPDAAFLTGNYPEETNSGTHFWYAPETSPFRPINSWTRVAEHIPHIGQLALRKWLRHKAFTARIPFSLLSYFDIVQKYGPLDEKFSNFETIFGLLKKSEKKTLYIGAPISIARNEKVLARLKNASLKGVDLIFLFVGDLDRIGHQCGPDSEEYRRGVQEMGEFVGEATAFIRKQTDLSSLLIFGDHGMVKVEQLVNVQKVLRNSTFSVPKDYIYFLDSTLARFWFFNKAAEQGITEAMNSLEGGRFVSEEEKKIYKIRYSHNRFGEAIWWADEGSLILPNFWQGSRPVKGMHGYRKEALDNHAGFALIDSNIKGNTFLKEPAEMVDVFATIIDMLELKRPDSTYGVSLYRRNR